MTRRRFVAVTSAGVVASPVLARGLLPGTITAQEVADRIGKNLHGEPGPQSGQGSTEGFKAGDPATPVRGIATTALATLAVLQAAVKAGCNMVVTCEPTFYSKADTPTPPVRRLPGAPPPPADAPPPPPDPVFTAKADFIREHKLVVYRLNERWRTQPSNPYSAGLSSVLGWPHDTTQEDLARVKTPETSLEALVAHTRRSLKMRGGLRVIGDPQLRVRTVALLPGSTPIQAALQALPHVDTLLVGEVREWETVEYVRDVVDLGGKKSLLYVGRTVSEDPGMKVCADWLKTVIPEVKSTWCTAGDPYWRPVA